MVYPPLLYSISKELGIDVRDVAQWPPQVVDAWLAYLEWDEIQEDKREAEREAERERDEKRRKAKARGGRNPPRPTFSNRRG